MLACTKSLHLQLFFKWDAALHLRDRNSVPVSFGQIQSLEMQFSLNSYCIFKRADLLYCNFSSIQKKFIRIFIGVRNDHIVFQHNLLRRMKPGCFHM